MLIGKNPGHQPDRVEQSQWTRQVDADAGADRSGARGLVRRKRTTEDRRTYRLSLTPAGEKDAGRTDQMRDAA